jgi:endonuclease/exonuclease/phosphatase family metal-dependent hydrolase
MTFNTHGGRPPGQGADITLAAGVIRAADPDIAGLQEIHHFLPPPGVFQDQPGQLRRALGGEVTFRPSLGTSLNGYGNAIASKRRPTRVRRVALPGAGEPRALLEAWFELWGRPFRLWCTHFGLDAVTRLQQSRAVLEERGDPVLPTILLGDLNGEPESPEVQLLLEHGFRHAVPQDHPSFPADVPSTRIDYVLVSQHWEIVEGRLVETQVSDHLPLIAELVLRGTPTPAHRIDP